MRRRVQVVRVQRGDEDIARIVGVLKVAEPYFEGAVPLQLHVVLVIYGGGPGDAHRAQERYQTDAAERHAGAAAVMRVGGHLAGSDLVIHDGKKSSSSDGPTRGFTRALGQESSSARG